MFLDDKIENNFNNFYHSNNNNIKSNEYVNNNNNNTNTNILSNNSKSYFVTPNTNKYTYSTKYRSKNIYPKSKNK
jgi:hypothetical protein